MTTLQAERHPVDRLAEEFVERYRRGERPAIVLVHGYRGLDDGQRAVTRRFAQEGFVCLLP